MRRPRTGLGDAETRRHLLSVLVVAWTLAAVVPAAAQTALLPGRFEVSVGVGLLGGTAFGEMAADERAGGAGASYRLFDSETTLASSRIVDARLGVAITRRFAIEGRAALGHPELRTSLSGDVEGAPAITAVEQVDQYTFDGGIAVSLDEWRVLGLVPFASGGVGYLRQLHEGQALVEEGHLYYAGGGIRRGLFMRQRGFVRAAGFRADVRIYVFSSTASMDEGSRSEGAVSGSLFVVF